MWEQLRNALESITTFTNRALRVVNILLAVSLVMWGCVTLTMLIFLWLSDRF